MTYHKTIFKKIVLQTLQLQNEGINQEETIKGYKIQIHILIT